MKDLSMKELTTIALLGVLILISGSFKIPSPIAGGEFQLSAPIAVLICACFGFKRYIIAGILASMLGMMLGMHNIINVLVQMVFRVVAGGTMACSEPTCLPLLSADRSEPSLPASYCGRLPV